MEPAHEPQPLAAPQGRPGSHIRWHRTRLHLSQEALAEAMGVSTKSIKRWEQNRALPQPYHRERLCRLLSIDPALFLRAPEVEESQSSAAQVPLWYVPFPRNPFFTGRDELLQQLQTLLSMQHAAALTQAYALSGLGGIGKTQVALEYAYRHAQDYTAIFWLGAETEESLLTDAAAIATLLELPERAEADQNRLLAAFTRWLASRRDWLLILDNLEEEALAQRLLPPTWQGALLLTTRRQALGPLAQPLEVDQLTSEEGVLLLLQRARLLGPTQEPLPPEEEALVQVLVAELGGLPLALDQAGAYLEETRCRIADYVQLYRHAPLRLLGERSTAQMHPASVARTFGLAYERLERHNAGAAALVQIYAYLAPEAIPEDLIKAGTEHLGQEVERLVADPFAYQAAFKALLSSGLLRRQTQAGTVMMHRLVQAVLREQLGEASQQTWAERVVRLVAAAFPDPKAYATWEQCQRLLPHVLACADHIERWGFRFPEGARLLNQAGEYLRQRGQYRAALPLVQQGLALRDQALGSDHPDVAESLHTMGLLAVSQGDYAEAVPLCQRSLALWEQALGPDHSEVARCLHTLAVSHELLGQYEQAQSCYQRALTIREQVLGPNHPEVANTLNSLGVFFWTLGKYREAVPLCQQALAIWEPALGPDHPQVARCLHNMALLYYEQGYYTEAMPLCQRALALWEQAFGPDHPLVARCMKTLAHLYKDQGQSAEALPLYQRALALCEQALGPSQPEVAESLDALAECYYVQGQYEQALPLVHRAHMIYEQTLGSAYPDVAENLNILALLTHAQGQAAEALPLAERALSIREQALGPDHPKIALSLNTLAALYQTLGQSAEALLLYERAVKINEQMLPDHPNTATSLEHLAALLRQVGQADHADAMEARVQASRARRSNNPGNGEW